MITYHPTFKRTADGFIPMVNIRGPKGRMIGSRVCRHVVCATEGAAQSEAFIRAYRACDMAMGFARVAV